MTIHQSRVCFILMMAAAAVLAVVYVVTRVSIWLYLLLAVLIASSVIENIFDRCPECGQFLNFPFHRGNICPHCHKEMNLNKKNKIK